MESSLGGEPAGPVPNAQCGTSGSPPPRLPTCLLRAELADVCIDLNRVEVDCKTEQQVSRDPAGTQLNSPLSIMCYCCPLRKASSWEESCYLPVGTGTASA